MDEKLVRYQKHITQMFYSFDQFCEEHELKVFLVGGSALGAYRHQGFIPWDDDIDVAMFRDDFEKMEQLMAEKQNCLNGMRYSPVENQLIPEAPIGHLYDFRVTDKKECAPKIDIHPIDGVPEGKVSCSLQKITTLLYYLGIYHLPVKNKGRVIRNISKIMLKVIPMWMWRWILKKCKSYFTQWNAYESKNICSLFGVAGYSREVMPKDWLLPLRRQKFQEYEFWVPNKKEEYLTRLYGDWGNLPGEDKRKPQHDSYLECNIEEH